VSGKGKLVEEFGGGHSTEKGTFRVAGPRFALPKGTKLLNHPKKPKTTKKTPKKKPPHTKKPNSRGAKIEPVAKTRQDGEMMKLFQRSSSTKKGKGDALVFDHKTSVVKRRNKNGGRCPRSAETDGGNHLHRGGPLGDDGIRQNSGEGLQAEKAETEKGTLVAGW